MSDDPLEEILSALGPHPVDALAQIIHDEMQTTPGPFPTSPEIGAAKAVYDWHRSQVLDFEHVETEAQNWYDRNAHAVLPDWGGLYRILTGDQMDNS